MYRGSGATPLCGLLGSQQGAHQGMGAWPVLLVLHFSAYGGGWLVLITNALNTGVLLCLVVVPSLIERVLQEWEGNARLCVYCHMHSSGGLEGTCQCKKSTCDLCVRGHIYRCNVRLRCTACSGVKRGGLQMANVLHWAKQQDQRAHHAHNACMKQNAQCVSGPLARNADAPDGLCRDVLADCCEV